MNFYLFSPFYQQSTINETMILSYIDTIYVHTYIQGVILTPWHRHRLNRCLFRRVQVYIQVLHPSYTKVAKSDKIMLT